MAPGSRTSWLPRLQPRIELRGSSPRTSPSMEVPRLVKVMYCTDHNGIVRACHRWWIQRLFDWTRRFWPQLRSPAENTRACSHLSLGFGYASRSFLGDDGTTVPLVINLPFPGFSRSPSCVLVAFHGASCDTVPLVKFQRQLCTLLTSGIQTLGTDDDHVDSWSTDYLRVNIFPNGQVPTRLPVVIPLHRRREETASLLARFLLCRPIQVVYAGRMASNWQFSESTPSGSHQTRPAVVRHGSPELCPGHNGDRRGANPDAMDPKRADHHVVTSNLRVYFALGSRRCQTRLVSQKTPSVHPAPVRPNSPRFSDPRNPKLQAQAPIPILVSPHHSALNLKSTKHCRTHISAPLIERSWASLWKESIEGRDRFEEKGMYHRSCRMSARQNGSFAGPGRSPSVRRYRHWAELFSVPGTGGPFDDYHMETRAHPNSDWEPMLPASPPTISPSQSLCEAKQLERWHLGIFQHASFASLHLRILAVRNVGQRTSRTSPRPWNLALVHEKAQIILR